MKLYDPIPREINFSSYATNRSDTSSRSLYPENCMEYMVLMPKRNNPNRPWAVNALGADL